MIRRSVASRYTRKRDRAPLGFRGNRAAVLEGLDLHRPITNNACTFHRGGIEDYEIAADRHAVRFYVERMVKLSRSTKGTEASVPVRQASPAASRTSAVDRD